MGDQRLLPRPAQATAKAKEASATAHSAPSFAMLPSSCTSLSLRGDSLMNRWQREAA
ncbi:hypothetical protein AHAS_Ahas02G0110800 [Arachis hypogaea]